ncbi:MAG: aromatic ring-hydroxylating dioxygenase subunit alpha [Rubrivivax sp.]|jgi:phenylpropionate dioxygenase-like ring-hydroxylating dioxygenase large terminal subunit|nr:aromatic ring-hydroxylating dioxygenase subunit alpha [Rubrivivax sp.]
MNETRWWWPVAAEGEVADAPLAVELLGDPLVLWRDGGGAPVLFADRCPHRGARLSMGRVEGGTLRCAYHGWRFDGGGRCIAVPSAPGFEPPASCAARALSVQVAHGMVWAGFDGAEAGPPVLDGLAQRRLVYGPFDVETSAPRAVENFLDTSHFAFVHEGWLGDAAHPEVPAHEVTATADGRPVIERYPAWQPRASAAAAGGDWVDYRYEVLSPFAALLTKQGRGGGPEDSYVIWACPAAPERCRLWFAQYTSDLVTPDDTLRDFQVAIFAQDRPVLESQRPRRLPLASPGEGGEAMCAADRLSAAYRRYLRSCGITFGVC